MFNVLINHQFLTFCKMVMVYYYLKWKNGEFFLLINASFDLKIYSLVSDLIYICHFPSKFNPYGFFFLIMYVDSFCENV